MTNPRIPAGIYAIRPKDGPQDHYLTIGPHLPVEPPPDAPVINIGPSNRFPWELKDTDTGTSTVHYERYKWIIKGNALYVSANDWKEAVELDFRRSDTGFVFINKPGSTRSSRLTYNKDASSSQPNFTFQEADDSDDAQVFEVIRIF